MKPEIRSSKSFRRSCALSGFGLRICFGFRISGFGFAAGLAVLLAIGGLAFGQAQPGVVMQPPPTAQPGTDPLMSLMLSQPGVDMESPVVAQAEFDPPVAALGARVIYRVSLNAMSDAVKLPEKLPTPSGMGLTAGARGQTYVAAAPKLIPRTTLNFRVSVANAGTYVIPAFTLTAYGKPVQVPAARITVQPAGMPAGREAARLVVELPKGDIYVGQTLNLQVILADPGDNSLQGLSQVQVSGEGFLTEQSFYRVRREVVNRGGRGMLALIYDVSVTPILGGTNLLTVQGHAIYSRVVPGQGFVPGTAMMNNPLVESDPIPILVKSLPKDGELPGFTGAIGAFSLDPPRTSTNEVRAGDPLTLSVTVRGSGNIGRLIPPKIPSLREWQAFPPSTDPTPAYAIQQRGSYSFSYTIIPLSDRLKSTPAIPFSFFDPQRSAYVNLTIPPVPLTVKPGPSDVTLAAQQRAPSSPGLDEESDTERELVLTGLAETPGRRVGSLEPLQQRAWFPALQLFPAFALAALWAWDRRRRYLEAHPEVVLKRRARRGLRRQLRMARQAASARDAGAFVRAAVEALREACAPHSAATPAALVCGDVLQELPVEDRQGRSGEIVRRFFAAADASRFGSASGNGTELLALQSDLEQLLGNLRARL